MSSSNGSRFSSLLTWLPNFNIKSQSRRHVVRLNNIARPSPTFTPLAILRGLAGVIFICQGEFFWMHLHRIGLPVNGKVMGGMALGLGSVMVFGAIMGAAAVSVSNNYTACSCWQG